MKSRRIKNATAVVQWFDGLLERCAEEHRLRCETCVEIFTRRRGCPTKGTKEQIAAGKALRRRINAELQEHRNDREECSDVKTCRLARSCWLEKRLVKWAKKVCNRCSLYAYTIVAATFIFTHISSPNLLHHIFAEFIPHKAHISVLPQNAAAAEVAAGGGAGR
jgi:hypothetical protein